MRRLLKRFLGDKGGNFGVITAIALVPLAGVTGLGVDFSQAYSVRTTLQGEADSIAIAVASEGPGVTSRYYGPMIAVASTRVRLADTEFSGRWISPTEYAVDASADVTRTLSRMIPIGGDTIDVSVRSVAQYLGARLDYKPPSSTLLDPNAWDYNQIYAYCFNAAEARSGKSNGRSKRILVADNAGGNYSKNPFPRCGAGETMSFELLNVIEGKHRPSNRNSSRNYRYYYTDTTRDEKDVDTHNLGVNIVETILCDNLAQCKSKPIGIIPVGQHRTPLKNTKPCSKGKYMYYGWEDRPDGDRDFDDIRIVIECPEWVKTGDESVKLVR